MKPYMIIIIYLFICVSFEKAFGDSDLKKIKIAISNNPYGEFSLASSDNSIINIASTKSDSVHTLFVKTPYNEKEHLFILSFAGGPTFFLILNDLMEVIIDFNTPFDFNNINPKVINSSHTTDLWAYYEGLNNLIHKRLSDPENAERLLYEEFEFVKDICLNTDSPALADYTFIVIQLMLNKFDVLRGKVSEVELIHKSLSIKYADISLIKSSLNKFLLYKEVTDPTSKYVGEMFSSLDLLDINNSNKTYNFKKIE